MSSPTTRPPVHAVVLARFTLACVLLGCGAGAPAREHASAGRAERQEHAPSAPEDAQAPATQRLAAGQGHTCFVARGGSVYCWGANDLGQLGRDAPRPSAVPVEVPGLSDAIGAVAGYGFTCALHRDGGVSCWGSRVGADTESDASAPRRVPGLDDAAQLAATYAHVCARRRGGEVACWALGNDTEGRAAPAAPSGISGAIDLATTLESSCILDRARRVLCWGEDRASAGHVVLDDAGDVLSISGGTHRLCALRRGGAIACWERLRDGPPSQTFHVEGAVRITTGRDYGGPQDVTCAIDERGELACWGAENAWGKLGNGTVDGTPSPARVEGIAGVVEVAAGFEHMCALTRDDGVYCWGTGNQGQLGNGSSGRVATATVVDGLTEAVAIEGGGPSMCASRSNGENLCWGRIADAQVIERVWRPTPVTRGQLHVGPGLACAAREGAPSCWIGRLPATVSLRTTPRSLVSFRSDTELGCALDHRDRTHCWGSGAALESLGLAVPEGSDADATIVVPVRALDGALRLEASETHLCALMPAGRLACLGDNSAGALGDGTTASRGVPRPVPGLSNVIDVALGDGFTCALHGRSGVGEVVCFGGEALGRGAAFERDEPPPEERPYPVEGLTNATRVVAGAMHACALRADRTVACWGRGGRAQLGDGRFTDADAPVQVAGVSDAIELAASAETTCALLANGTVTCWGSSEEGEGGGGRAPVALRPEAVVGLPAH